VEGGLHRGDCGLDVCERWNEGIDFAGGEGFCDINDGWADGCHCAVDGKDHVGESGLSLGNDAGGDVWGDKSGWKWSISYKPWDNIAGWELTQAGEIGLELALEGTNGRTKDREHSLRSELRDDTGSFGNNGPSDRYGIDCRNDISVLEAHINIIVVVEKVEVLLVQSWVEISLDGRHNIAGFVEERGWRREDVGTKGEGCDGDGDELHFEFDMMFFGYLWIWWGSTGIKEWLSESTMFVGK